MEQLALPGAARTQEAILILHGEAILGGKARSQKLVRDLAKRLVSAVAVELGGAVVPGADVALRVAHDDRLVG